MAPGAVDLATLAPRSAARIVMLAPAGATERSWRRAVLVISLGQVLLALTMLALPGTEIMLDEGGVNKTRAVALLPGAWVWLAALSLPALGLFAAPRHLFVDPEGPPR